MKNIPLELVECADSPSRVVEEYLAGKREAEQPGGMLSMRLGVGTMQRLQDLAAELDAPKTTLARSLLEGALSEALGRFMELTGDPAQPVPACACGWSPDEGVDWNPKCPVHDSERDAAEDYAADIMDAREQAERDQ